MSEEAARELARRMLGKHAVIGFPIAHSVSPEVHMAAAHDLGMIDFKYERLLVRPENLEIALRALRTSNGFNVTVPHKEAVLKYLLKKDFVDPVAKKIGAVNTVVPDANGHLKGYNTDWEGFANTLEYHSGEYTPLKGQKVVIAGTGGAARAMIYGAQQRGADVMVIGRDYEKAEKLAEKFDCRSGHLQDISLYEGNVLANATSVGMKNISETIAEKEELKGYHYVFDAVFNPLTTRLLMEAEQAGATPINGLHMLVRQAVPAFEKWTGRDPNQDVMYKAAEAALKKQ